MSSRSFVNYSLLMLGAAAMVLGGLAEDVAAQQTPPPLPPPSLGRPGGPDDPAAALGRNRGGPPPEYDGRGGGRTGRGGRSGMRGADSAMGKAKPKFEDLLENKDLSRFRGYASKDIGDGWSIDGKYLYFDGSSGSGDIITVDEYDDFELQFDFKVTEGGNSGVMYRVSLGDNAPYFSGPEYQVLDDEEHPDGKNELTSAGSLYGMYAPENKKNRAAGTWNQARIICKGNKVTHYLNGVKVVEAEIGSDEWNERLNESKFKDWDKFAKNKKGHIAFQDHGNEVWYRKIRIKRLSDTATASRSRGDSRANSGGQAARTPTIPRRSGRPRLKKPSFRQQGSSFEDPDKKGDDGDRDR